MLIEEHPAVQEVDAKLAALDERERAHAEKMAPIRAAREQHDQWERERAAAVVEGRERELRQEPEVPPSSASDENMPHAFMVKRQELRRERRAVLASIRVTIDGRAMAGERSVMDKAGPHIYALLALADRERDLV